MLAQPPDIGLVTSQTGTVNAALLSGTDTDGLSVLDVANRVRLRIFQRDEGDNQVALGLRCKGLVLRGDILKQGRVVELDFVAALLEGDAIDLLALDGLRFVCRVNLDDIVGSLALVLQNLDGLGGVVGGNDAVRDLALQQQGRCGITGVAQGNEVAVRRHTVSTAGTGVCAGNRRIVQSLDVIDEVDFLQRVRQRQSHSGTSR